MHACLHVTGFCLACTQAMQKDLRRLISLSHELAARSQALRRAVPTRPPSCIMPPRPMSVENPVEAETKMSVEAMNRSREETTDAPPDREIEAMKVAAMHVVKEKAVVQRVDLEGGDFAVNAGVGPMEKEAREASLLGVYSLFDLDGDGSVGQESDIMPLHAFIYSCFRAFKRCTRPPVVPESPMACRYRSNA